MTAHLHLLYALVGALALGLALVSRAVRRLPVSEPLVALALGVVVGPRVLGVVETDLAAVEVVLREGARLLLAWSVMAAALRFRLAALRDVAAAAVVLLAVAMPLAAAVAGAATLLLGLPVALALLVGCCLSPTDPVLAASVVTGEPARRGLPGRLRRMLTLESGANDGLALPLVALASAAALPADDVAAAVPGAVVDVVGAVAVGGLVGALAAVGARVAGRHRELEPGPRLVLPMLLSVAVLGLALVIGVGGVLAVFVAGLAYSGVLEAGRDGARNDAERSAQDEVDEAVNRYAVLPLLVLLGVVLPWDVWWSFGPQALVFVVLVLVLRRPPVVLALARALGLRPRTALFAGWFGPMGVSALFYLLHSREQGVADPRVFAAGTLAVAASVVAAGLSAAPLRERYARATSSAA